MLTVEQNERITRTGPGTPAGVLMRRYWQPVALADELAGNRPVRRVRVLGEDFVLFRDERGRAGLLDRHCPHRGADLCYGRLEDGGLRCPFHGWLFDVEGRCLEQPAEPEGSRYFERIRAPAYPCVERNGMVFAYLGPGEPPALPALDCFAAPPAQSFAFKGHVACNWLQALEVGIDPAHASFLHRFLEDEDPAAGYGLQFRDRVADSDLPMTALLRKYPRPEIRVEPADHGLRIVALRRLADGNVHVRVTNQVFPHGIVIPMSNEMNITQWHVPVDDESCYWYAYFTSFGAPVDAERMRAQRLELYSLPDYMPRVNRDNDYGYDPQQQRTETYTGMGADINVHDQWAVESMGAIADRTREHLGKTDAAIIAYRKLLGRAIDAAGNGADGLPMVLDAHAAAALRGPVAVDAIAPESSWEEGWKRRDLERRAASGWAEDPWASGG